MPTIAEVRQQYPQYSDMSDTDLAGALHKKFYSDMPQDEFNQKIGLKAEAKAPDDHGLTRRQAMSGPEKVLSPITEYPRNYAEMNQEARDQMSRGAGQIYEGAFGSGLRGDVPKFAGGLGNVALGAMGYIGSPISAAYRSVIGQPVEDVTGIPREYTEFGAQLATPGIGFGRMPGKPGAPVNPANYRPGSVAPEAPTMSTTPSAAEAAAAMERLRAEGIDVDLPRGMTSDSVPVQRSTMGLANTPIIGDPIAKAVHDTVPAQIRQGRDVLAARSGNATPANAADRAANVLAEKAAAETKAATEAAQRGDEAAAAAHQKAADDAYARIAAYEAESGAAVEAQTGKVDPFDTGAQTTEAFRAAEAEAKAKKNRLYDVAGETPGIIKSEGVGGLHGRIKGDLEAGDVNIDYPSTTGTAINMMDAVKKFEGGLFPGAPIVKAEAAAAPKVAPAPGAVQSGQSLTEFLAGKLGPDAELSAIGADKHLVDVTGVGKRRLVKQGGWTLDAAREAAEEAGYLRGDHKGTSTTNDLLDALDAEMRGNKRFAEGAEGGATARETAAASERARAEQSAFRRGLEKDLADAGHGELGPQVKQRTLKIMEDERLSPDDAVDKALRQLDNEASNARHGPEGDFPGDRPLPAEGVSVQGMFRFRKNLRAIARGAERGSEDERAASKIIDAYDAWQEEAMQKHLLSGDPKALEKFQEANKANREWRQDFGYNEKRDVNNLAQKVLHQDVTPEEVANYLIGSGKIGKQGTTSRLYDMLMKATGNSEELAQSIRGAIWEKLSSSKNAAADIREFVHRSGRSLAERAFPEGARELMLRHADVLDAAKTARDRVGEVAKTNAPKPTKVETGPMQQLADRVIGGKLDKGEALWKTIEGYTKKGGDLKALSGLVRELPADMKGDIAGAVVRGLGRDHAGNFSLDKFASDWGGLDGGGKITPQAKAILFGNAGAHLKSLDDLATIASRLKDVKKKYGNPSGTGQTTAFQKLAALATGIIGGQVAPGLAALSVGGAGAGYIGARVLASPAGAASLAKHAKALEQQAKAPTAQSQALVSMTERNLVNTIKTLSAVRSAPSGAIGGMRQLQGTVPAGAQSEQR